MATQPSGSATLVSGTIDDSFPEGPPAWLQTPAASRLLARGAKFIPTPRMTGVCNIGQAFDKFARSTHLRLYFGDTPMHTSIADSSGYRTRVGSCRVMSGTEWNTVILRHTSPC